MQKKYSWHKVSFFLPLLVVVIISICDGINPWGDRCLLHIDMYHQYCPFTIEMLRKLQEGGSVFYTWRQGLGADFIAMYAYYLASPWNLLLIIWPKDHVIEFMEVMTWIKIAGASLGAFIWITGHFHLQYGKERNPRIYLAIVGGMAYAMSGYMAAYSWDVMWLDTIMLAPFVLRGLEKMVDEKKPTMYYVSLTLAIWSNYYIAMMLCGFLVLYAIAYAIMSCRGFKQVGMAAVRFGLYSMLAGGSCMVILIPEVIMMNYTYASNSTFPAKMRWYFSLVTELGRGTATATVYTGVSHFPNIYAGSFVLVLMWMFLLNNKIAIRKRVLGALGVAFFLASFDNNWLDYIWHGLHFPNSLPARQSYLYILIILLISFSVLEHWDGVKLWHVLAGTAVAAVFLIWGGIITDATITEPFAFIFTGLFVAVYFILMLLRKLTGEHNRKRIVLFATVVAMAEIIANFAVTGFYTFSRSSYVARMDDYENLIEYAEEQEDGFFRMEDGGRMTKNDNTLYGYCSASTFSSNCNCNVSDFYQHLYMEAGTNFYCFNGTTPLTSALFSVKYTILTSDQEENAYRKLVASSGKYYLYENTLCLPMGYVMPEELAENWPNNANLRIQNINEIATALGAEEDMLALDDNIFQSVTAGETSITVNQDGMYYLASKTCDADSLTVSVGDRSRSFSKTTHKYLLEVGQCQAGDEIKITNSTDNSVEFYVYRLNDEATMTAYNTLASQSLQVEEMTDTKITGTIDVTNSGRLVFPIAAEEGWTIYVDGEEQEMASLDGTLLGVEISSGHHTVELRYMTPGVKVGGGISLLCLALAGFFLWRNKKKVNGNN